MGMFDRIYDASKHEWQTKAYDCNLDNYWTGDEMPALAGVPADYQVEVIGGDGPFIDAFATVRAGRLAAIGVGRDESLPHVDYYGHLVTEVKP